MGMNGRAVRKGFAFSSTPDMALWGEAQKPRGKEVQNKKEVGFRVPGGEQKISDRAGKSGHMMGHVTKQ